MLLPRFLEDRRRSKNIPREIFIPAYVRDFNFTANTGWKIYVEIFIVGARCHVSLSLSLSFYLLSPLTKEVPCSCARRCNWSSKVLDSLVPKQSYLEDLIRDTSGIGREGACYFQGLSKNLSFAFGSRTWPDSSNGSPSNATPPDNQRLKNSIGYINYRPVAGNRWYLLKGSYVIQPAKRVPSVNIHA